VCGSGWRTAAAVAAVLLAGCSGDDSTGASGEGADDADVVEAAYGGVTFEVPSDWPVVQVEDSYSFVCASAGTEGVYLPPEDLVSVSCRSTDEYAMTLHVFPHEPNGLPPEDAEVVGTGDDVRWIRQNPSNRWRSVTFPARGLRLEFYETPDPVVDAVLASVDGHR
jgi:hypothetical protein